MSAIDLPWAAMLKVAGVTVAEVAERADLSESYVYQQLRGAKPMQYPTERACKQAIGARQGEWYPAVAALVRLIHDWSTEKQVRQILAEARRKPKGQRQVM